MKAQKCCAHCPGKLVPLRSIGSHHVCCQPNYVSGNLKISSLNKNVTEYPGRETKRNLPEDRSVCYDQFALAKKLHAENLEHQPLPDKVDDSVFKNPRPTRSRRLSSSRRCCECCERERDDDSESPSKRNGPILGCKEPKTKMDLAICWETPMDPIYEPSRSTHIDGSEGGLAPAIFTLVQHASTSTATVRSEGKKNEENSARCPRCRARISQEDCSRNENKEEDRRSPKCCCECLCEDLNGVNISKKNRIEERSKKGSFRKCVACKSKNFKDDPRLIRSAVGLTLGLEESGNNRRKSDNKTTIPRPKTPFARRSFCIDTLTPPFSVMNGCRDADYPEHWRLMSVYQQSYKNPFRRRNYRC